MADPPFHPARFSRCRAGTQWRLEHPLSAGRYATRRRQSRICQSGHIAHDRGAFFFGLLSRRVAGSGSWPQHIWAIQRKPGRCGLASHPVPCRSAPAALACPVIPAVRNRSRRMNPITPIMNQTASERPSPSRTGGAAGWKSSLGRVLNIFAAPGDVLDEVLAAPVDLVNWRLPTLLVCFSALVCLPFRLPNDLTSSGWPLAASLVTIAAALAGSLWSA